jgi:hypothetical protein
MPCRDDGYPVGQDPTELNLRSQLRQQKKRLDLATRAACAIEKLLTEAQIRELDKETFAWILEHRERDRKRREQAAEKKLARKQARQAKETAAALRQQAIGKLTPAERKALGL